MNLGNFCEFRQFFPAQIPFCNWSPQLPEADRVSIPSIDGVSISGSNEQANSNTGGPAARPAASVCSNSRASTSDFGGLIDFDRLTELLSNWGDGSVYISKRFNA